MNRILDVPILLEFYGGLLTERQADIISLYCDEDYSLSEIAENLQISRQAVHDSLRNGLAALQEYEEKMGLVKNYGLKREIGNELIEMLIAQETTGQGQPDAETIRAAIDKINSLVEL